jgi:hypothetical protein
MSWILALKQYNDKKGSWSMPRKGTPEHAEVVKIMEKMKGKPAEKPMEKMKTAKKPKAESEAEEVVKKPRKVVVPAEEMPTKKTRKVPESGSDSDIPVPKPKVRAEPKAKAEPKAVPMAMEKKSSGKK